MLFCIDVNMTRFLQSQSTYLDCMDLSPRHHCLLLSLCSLRKSRRKSPSLRATRRNWPHMPLLLLQSEIQKIDMKQRMCIEVIVSLK